MRGGDESGTSSGCPGSDQRNRRKHQSRRRCSDVQFIPQHCLHSGHTFSDIRLDRHPTATMCREAPCATCGKRSWAGCGQHAAAVMANIPKSEQCTCKPVPAAK